MEEGVCWRAALRDALGSSVCWLLCDCDCVDVGRGVSTERDRFCVPEDCELALLAPRRLRWEASSSSSLEENRSDWAWLRNVRALLFRSFLSDSDLGALFGRGILSLFASECVKYCSKTRPADKDAGKGSWLCFDRYFY